MIDDDDDDDMIRNAWCLNLELGLACVHGATFDARVLQNLSRRFSAHPVRAAC